MHLTKRVSSLLMASLFLSSTSIQAMDNSDTSEQADKAYRTAYAALDVLNAATPSWASGRRNPPLPATDQSREELLKIAKEKLEAALAMGHPFAAAGLRHVYTTASAPEKLKTAFEKSIQFKKTTHTTAGLDADLSSLLDLLNLSSKNVDDLLKIEEIHLKKAIASYGVIAEDLTHPETARALGALVRLGDSTDTWFPLAEAYFKKGEYPESLKWYGKAISSQNPAYGLFESLQRKTQNTTLADSLTLEFHRLLNDYAAQHCSAFSAFPIHLTYYNMVKDDQDARFKIAGFLAKIAESHFEEKPEWLYDFAQAQESTITQETEYSALLDMYLRCAHRGIWPAIEKIVDTPILLEKMGLDNAALILLRYVDHHKGREKLLAAYAKSEDENNVFPVIFSLMMPERPEFQSTLTRLTQHYPPAIDLHFHNLDTTLGAEALKAKALWIEHMKESIKSQGESEPSLTIGGRYLNPPLSYYFPLFVQEFPAKDITKHHDYDHWDPYSAQPLTSRIVLKIQIAKEHITKLEKEQEEKQAYIAKFRNLKAQLITQLTADDAYNLAQEYNFLHRVCEMHFDSPSQRPSSFREGYVTCLEEATKKGSVPAFEELRDLFSKGYMEKFYHSYPRSFQAFHYERAQHMKDFRTPEAVDRVARLLEEKKS